MTESLVQVGVDPEILFYSFLDDQTIGIDNGGDEVAADDDTECLDEFGGYFDKAFNLREVSKWQYKNFESTEEVADMNAVSKRNLEPLQAILSVTVSMDYALANVLADQFLEKHHCSSVWANRAMHILMQDQINENLSVRDHVLYNELLQMQKVWILQLAYSESLRQLKKRLDWFPKVKDITIEDA